MRLKPVKESVSKPNDDSLTEPQTLIITARPNRRFYSSEECLRDEGWTDFAIAKFLPASPDVIGPAPLSAAGDPPVKYWLRRRMQLLIKTSEEYRTWRNRSAQQLANKKEREREGERIRGRLELGIR